MSKLDELITLFCPKGVPLKPLGKLGKFYGGLTGKSKNDFTDGNAKFITYKNVYSNPALQIDVEDRVKIADGEKQRTLEYGDVIFTGSSETPDECGISSVVTVKTDEKLYLNSFCFIFRFNDLGVMLPDFAKHLFRSSDLRYQIGKTASGVTRFNVSKKLMERVIIPLPPIEVQSEIIRILDNFTEFTAELTAELTVRKKQYEYYRNLLLEHPKNESAMVAISDLGKWSGGKTPSTANKEYWENGTIPWISSKDMKLPTIEDTEDHLTEQALTEGGMTLLPDGTVAIVTRSGILRHTFPVAYVPFRTTVNQDIKVLIVKDGLSARYMFHALQSYGEDIRKTTKKQRGTVDSLDFQKVLAYKIPVPLLDIQNRLVEVLDNFEAICSDLKIDLPAEIEARQKQYEFYRDALLTYAATGQIIAKQAEYNDLIILCQYVFGVVFLKIEDVVTVFRGEYITKKDATAGNIPVILGGQEPAYYIDKANHIGEVVVVARSGASAGFVSYWNEPIFVTDGFGYEAQSKLMITKYLYYILKNMEKELNDSKRGAGVPHISGSYILNIKIPVPSLGKQKKIVSTIDCFDALCNDISSGLPAEIEARTKQYEYYRDKLLTFKPAR